MNTDTMQLYSSLSPILEPNTTLGKKLSNLKSNKETKSLVQITMNNMAKKSLLEKTSNFLRSESPPTLNRNQVTARHQKFDETKFLKKLYIYKLPLDLNPNEIEEMFHQFGKIVDIDYKRHKNTMGITCRIDFHSMKSVQAALRGPICYRGQILDLKPGRIPQKYSARVKYDIAHRNQLERPLGKRRELGTEFMKMSPKMPSRVFVHGMAEPLTKNALEKSICLFLHGFNINNVFVEFKPYVSHDLKLKKCGFMMIHGFQHEFAAALIKVQEKFEILGTTVTCWLPHSEDVI